MMRNIAVISQGCAANFKMPQNALLLYRICRTPST